MTTTASSSTPLTARNLSEQNWQLDHPSSPATDPAPPTPAADDADPEMKALNTDMEGMAVGPAMGRGESSRSVNGKTVFEKKRKYSADLYEYTKGMWQVIRDDIEWVFSVSFSSHLVFVSLPPRTAPSCLATPSKPSKPPPSA